ncbi:hypothetical protein ABZ569_32780 [Streptomyces albus]|uniref:hypothetical protein n=1 Tax=Streptomyces albus TaxID=1888 RepID=UPI0033F0A9D8
MTDITDTAPAAGTDPLSPRDEARLSYAGTLFSLVDMLLDQIPIDPDPEPGALLAAALAVEQEVERLTHVAVIAERERNTPYEVLGQVAGISRQSAHKKWARAVGSWAARGRAGAYVAGHGPLERAARYDQWYAALRPDGPENAVSSGLDAVRCPGSHQLERARRDRAAACHQRRAALQRTWLRLSDVLSDAHGPDLVDTRRARAENEDQTAVLYEALIQLEPELAEEHRANAEMYRSWAARSRDYTDELKHLQED